MSHRPQAPFWQRLRAWPINQEPRCGHAHKQELRSTSMGPPERCPLPLQVSRDWPAVAGKGQGSGIRTGRAKHLDQHGALKCLLFPFEQAKVGGSFMFPTFSLGSGEGGWRGVREWGWLIFQVVRQSHEVHPTPRALEMWALALANDESTRACGAALDNQGRLVLGFAKPGKRRSSK